jgi:hypothetical protein
MENQNNSSSGIKRGVILLAISAVILLVIIFFLFFFFSLEKRDALLEKTINTPNPVVTNDKTAPATKETVNAVVGHETTGSETVATAAEKKTLGVLDFTEIKVLRRNDEGRIISFETIVNPNDSVDSDNDGISDKKEKSLGTDAGKSDTDGDEVSDYQELLMGTDPKVKDDFNKK